MKPLDVWKRAVCPKANPLILHTGARPWEGTPAFDVTQHVPNGKWVGTDIEGGNGVSLVADLHAIDKATEDRFDAVYSTATLEHLRRPWVAVKAMANVLKPGGYLYIDTHHTFPLHGYPNDYFRFSRQALSGMVEDAGLTDLMSDYGFPCTIIPPENVIWNPLAPSYLNVMICAAKGD